MNITILDKRIRIESDDYDKTFDFTKVLFVGTSLFFDEEEIALPIVAGGVILSLEGTLNGIVEVDENCADTDEAIERLKEHLQKVDLFFLARGNTTLPTIAGAINQYYNENIDMSQGVTDPVSIFGGGGGEFDKRHVYSWNQVGNLVTMNLRLQFATAGVAVQELICCIPNTMPPPAGAKAAEPDEALNGSSIITVGNCNWGDTSSNVGLGYVYLINTESHTWAIRINHTPQNTKFYQIQLQYFIN